MPTATRPRIRDDLMRIEPTDIYTSHTDLEALPGGWPGSLGRGA
jgi:hypothetical protein